MVHFSDEWGATCFSLKESQTWFWPRLSVWDDFQEQLFITDGVDRSPLVIGEPEGMFQDELAAKGAHHGFLAQVVHWKRSPKLRRTV